MREEFMNIIVILLILIGLLFFYFRSVQLDTYVKEGLTTRRGGDVGPSSSLSDHVEDLSIAIDKLKTSVSIDANRKNYEDIIIHLEDIINYSMMDYVSKMSPNKKFSDMSAQFAELNQMQTAKKTLNDLMAWLDKK